MEVSQGAGLLGARRLIHYHGGPITPLSAARAAWTARHAMISFAHPDQVALAAEVCQSFALDNGAFSEWRSNGRPVDVHAYLAWVNQWRQHPGFDWCIIPDIISGDETQNRALCEAWTLPASMSVPVWHLHESLDYLRWMIEAYPRVALGSSGDYSEPGTECWWSRMAEAMAVACDKSGRPQTKLHGLRMLNPTIFSHLPLSSADSCGVARNIGIDAKWGTGYLRGMSKVTRSAVLADRYERHASASTWEPREVQMSFTLLG